MLLVSPRKNIVEEHTKNGIYNSTEKKQDVKKI